MSNPIAHLKNVKDFLPFLLPVFTYFFPGAPNKKLIFVILYLVFLHLWSIHQMKKKNEENEELNNQLKQKNEAITIAENETKEVKGNYEKLYSSYSAFVNVDFAKIVNSIGYQYSEFHTKHHGKSRLKDDLAGLKAIAQDVTNLALEKQEELKNVDRPLSYRSYSKWIWNRY